jgi:hypothetical protein
MAGPTAAVLAKDFGEDQRLWLAAFLRSISEHASGDDFWVSLLKFQERGSGEGRPFIWSVRTMADDEDADRIREAFGFRPAGRIGFAAMCNDPEDHRILAHLCEKTARRTGGVIDFGGRLDEPFSIPAAGRVFDVNDGHVCTPEFLGEWLKAPRFHMVK